MKYVLTALAAILTACSTIGNTQAPLTFSSGHTAKFKTGDCIVVAKEYAEELRSDGTPKLVAYVEAWEDHTGNGAYILRMLHPRIGHPTYHALRVDSVDQYHVKTECTEAIITGRY